MPRSNLSEQWLLQARERLEVWRSDHSGDEFVALVTGNHDDRADANKPAIANKSLRHIAEASKRAARNPSQALLREQAKDLYDVLTALQAFTKIPKLLSQRSVSEVNQAIEAAPALGEANFIKSLETCAHTLALGSHSERPNDKRYTIVDGNPGSGKTTGCKAMAGWAGMPVAMLSGEDFNAMVRRENEEAGDAYQIFRNWLGQAIINSFGGYMNGIILLDDFHKTFEKEHDGAFCRGSERQNFFNLVKLMGDASQDSFASVTLSDGHEFPLNTTDVHLFMTTNRLPRELSSEGEEAQLSRQRTMHGACMKPQDRILHAANECTKLLNQITALGAIISPAAAQVACATFNEVAAIDIRYYQDCGQLIGHRGLCDLVGRVYSHLLARATKMLEDGSPLEPKTFALIPDFDLAATANSIKDYEKVIDSGQRRKQEMDNIRQSLERIRAIMQEKALPPEYCKALEYHISCVSCDNEDPLATVHARLMDYTHRVDMPSIKVLAERLMNSFSHLSGSGGESNPFGTLRMIAESILRRHAAGRKGRYDLLSQSNRPIQITYENKYGFDPRLYQDLARALGGIPVRVIDTGDLLAAADIAPRFFLDAQARRARAKAGWKKSSDFFHE